jgi:NAD+ kinase
MPALKPKGVLGLVLHPHSDPTAVVETLTTWARSHGKRVIVDARDAARLSDDVAVEPVSATELADQADALISLGGDGTMLGALRLVAKRPVPVLGVNLGNLGFLVEVEPNELDAARSPRAGGLQRRGTQWGGADRWTRRVGRVQRHRAR